MYNVILCPFSSTAKKNSYKIFSYKIFGRPFRIYELTFLSGSVAAFAESRTKNFCMVSGRSIYMYTVRELKASQVQRSNRTQISPTVQGMKIY